MGSRICLLLFVMLWWQYEGISRTDSGYARVLILGVIHTGNERFGYRDLAKELEQLKPDLILWEQSEPFKRVFGLRTAHFLRIWHPGIEQLALQKFTARRKRFEVLPFDIAIPNRKQYIKEIGENSQRVFEILDSVHMTAEDSIAFSDFAHRYTAFHNGLEKKSLVELNQEETIRESRELHRLEDSLVGIQLGRYSVDSSLLRWFLDEQKFWDTRNQFMAGRIRDFAHSNPGKMIIVLTGLNHKYYLTDLLKGELGIQLIPYLADFYETHAQILCRHSQTLSGKTFSSTD